MFHTLYKFTRIAQPLCLSQLITYFNDDTAIPIEEAYLYATGVVLCSVAITFNTHSMCFTSNHIGMRTRVATCSLIFRKVKPDLALLFYVFLKFLFPEFNFEPRSFM